MTPPARCIAYVTDRGYLLPTLVSAMQARVQLGENSDDIGIVIVQHDVTLDASTEAALDQVCLRHRIELRPVPGVVRAAIDELRRASGLFEGRLTSTTLARLFLPQLLPARYDDILYLDGDTQVLQSLRPVFEAPLPVGAFYAARDYVSIVLPFGPPDARILKAHLASLGLSGEAQERYFNAGVMRAHRPTWTRLGEDSLAFLRGASAEQLRFNDQSALNAVAGNDHLMLSSRWNFPKQFLHLTPEVVMAPALVHYLANPKPWHGRFHPWQADACEPYRALLAEQPALRPLLPRLDAARHVLHRLRSIRARVSPPRWYPDDAALRAALLFDGAAP